jgi:flavodoxin
VSSTSSAGVLLAFFSRPGENYWYGGRRHVEPGSTEILADVIADRVDCDVFRIEAAEPYPDDYEETVARNVREQDADARPRIATPLPDPTRYAAVILASPIWNVRPPMIMSTFVDGVDLSGTTVLPVVTYAVSGLGRTMEVYRQLAPGAVLGEGLAVRGEEAADAGPAVDEWLGRILPGR